jgi:hypothetical protein
VVSAVTSRRANVCKDRSGGMTSRGRTRRGLGEPLATHLRRRAVRPRLSVSHWACKVLLNASTDAPRGPRVGPMLWASRASFLTVTFAPPLGAAASPAAPWGFALKGRNRVHPRLWFEPDYPSRGSRARKPLDRGGDCAVRTDPHGRREGAGGAMPSASAWAVMVARSRR